MNNNRFMDVNPQNRGREMSAEMNSNSEPRESRFSRMKNYCMDRCPSSTSGWLVAVLTAVIVWQLLVSWSVLPSLTFPMVSGGKWQAMFLTNGQVYFGHLKEVNKDYVKMADIYYLQVSQQLQPSSSQSQQQISLVKLGNELHGPEDMMYVPKTQIVFWENMKNDSTVVQAIDALKKSEAEKAAQAE